MWYNDPMATIIGVTGHRPEKLNIKNVNGYNYYVQSRLRALAKRYLLHYSTLEVHVGGARGWDWAAIEASLELDLPYHLYLPSKMEQFTHYWEDWQKVTLDSFIAGAASVNHVERDSIRNELLARNLEILKNCNLLLAMWNGEESGGSYYTVKKAHDKGIVVKNLWSVWEKGKEYKLPLSRLQKINITRDGVTYPSLENFFQAMKTEDELIRKKIAAMNPLEAKKYGKLIPIRPNWEDVKDKVMKWGLRRKLASSYYLRILCDTGNEELIDWNYWHDNEWGHCYCNNCIGKGENKMGKMLMELRNELCEDSDTP